VRLPGCVKRNRDVGISFEVIHSRTPHSRE
jgi:hypothetical protein